MNTFRLGFAFKFLWRNWRSGEIKVLAAALALAVAVVTAIAVFADRMEQSLVRQSSSYLAADRVVEGRYVIPEPWLQQPKRYDLKQTRIAEFSSMVFYDEEMQLASVKAVGDGYPLRGKLAVSHQPFALDDGVFIAEGIPQLGEVWVDSRLLPLMNLNLGDSITIGNRDFVISQVLIREPDATNSFAVLGPRVMMNLNDLSSTGVILPGSRVTYRWLIAGEKNNIKRFENWLQTEITDHHRLISLQDAQQNIGAALDRGTRFLMLAGMIGVLLAGVAISIASQQFSFRHIDQVALMKSLGVSALQVRAIYFLQLVLLGIFASLIGVLLGEVIQQIITASIASLFKVVLLPASFWVYGVGFATGLLCLLGFALPPLWHLPKVSPLKVIRRELEASNIATWLKGLLGAVTLIVFIGFYSNDIGLTLSLMGGLSVVILSSTVLANFLLSLGQQLGSRAGSIWRLALSNLRRYQGQSITQIIVFACALMLLMVVFSMRTSLIDEWRLQLPEDAPNHFILNIASSETAEVKSLFIKNDFIVSPIYPMVLARLMKKNDYTYKEEDRDLSNVLRRELNLSWAEEMAPDNQLVEGEWWDSWSGKVLSTGVSIELDVAEELDIKIGDIVSFSLGGLTLEAEVASFRIVDWNAMTPNFYFLFSPGALDNYSPNYLTSLYLAPENKTFINQLLREFPTIVVLEVDRIIERIRAIVEQVSRSIELVLWLVLVGGMLVLIAAVNASMASRLQEAGLLRALGSGRNLILGSLCVEFSVMGFFAGVIAVFGAETLLLGLQYFVFDQAIRPHYILWYSGPLLGALFIGILGLTACRKVVTVPPSVVLRELEA